MANMAEIINELKSNTHQTIQTMKNELNRLENDINAKTYTLKIEYWTHKLMEFLQSNIESLNCFVEIHPNATTGEIRSAIKYKSFYIKNVSINDKEIRRKCPIGLLFIYNTEFKFDPNNISYLK